MCKIIYKRVITSETINMKYYHFQLYINIVSKEVTNSLATWKFRLKENPAGL